MALPALFVTIGAKVDQFEKSMGDVSKRLNAIDRDAQRAFAGFDKLGSRLTGIGTGITAAVTLPLAAAGSAATKFATDFDSEMRKVTSLLRGTTQKEFEDLSKATLQLSKDLGVDAVKSAEALYEAISAGVPKDNVIDFVSVATKAAIAGATDTKVAVDALTTITAAYGLELSEAAKVSDALFQAVNVGKFQFEDLAKAIGPAAQQASNLGISYEELLAATSTLSLTSGGVSIAVTQIESAMRSLIQPTKEMQAALKAAGYESGSAAIKALGFEGTLEKLRTTTGGNVESFNALFGRIEGATGALGLTGAKAQVAAEHFATLRASSDGLGSTQDALAERNKSAARQFEQLASQLKVVAIELGTVLLPSVLRLLEASRPLIDALAAIVDGFSKMPQPVQTAVIGIAALAAAIGPLLVVVGSAISSFATLGASITGGAGIAASFSALAATITSAVIPAILGLAAAWALWEFRDQLLGIQLLVAAFNIVTDAVKTLINIGSSLIEKAISIGQAIAAYLQRPLEILLKPLALVIDGYTFLAERLSRFNKEHEGVKLDVSIYDKFVEKLRGASEAVADVVAGQVNLTGALNNTGESTGGATRTVVDYTKALEKAEERFVTTLRAYQAGKTSLENLTKAQLELWRAQDAADPRKPAERFASAWEDAYKRYEKLADDIISLSGQIKAADEEIASSARDNAILFGKAHEAIRDAAKQTVAIVVPLNKRLPEGIQDAIKQTEAVRKAYETFGQKTPQELAKIVDANRKAWETIVSDSGSQSVNALEAWTKYEQSRQDAARRSGQVIPEEERKALQRAQDELDKALGKQKDSFGKFTQQVSTIINDLGKDLAKGTIDLFKGLFGFDDFNRKLKQDSAALRAELGERTSAIEAFQADVQSSIQAVEQKYAEQLANETQTLRDSLDQRRQEYEEFVSSTAESLESLRSIEGERLAAEQAELSGKLRDKEAEYTEYLARVGEKEQEIRDRHAQQLAGQLRDLQDNLRDRTQSYDDYVTDANTRLSRIGEDLAETIEDATRGINRRIEDENQDFARDVERINDDLRKAEKKGDKERVADLRKQLRHREQDHDKTIGRLKEDLAEQVSDAQRRATQQTDDLKTQLDRRTRDHAEYVDEIIRKQAEVTERHRSEQEQQLFDLQQSVDKRTRELRDFREETAFAIDAAAQRSAQKISQAEAEASALVEGRRKQLDEFETSVNAKIEATTEFYKGKTEEETKKLNEEIGNRIAEYERYRAGVVAKLEQLEADAKGPLDRLGDLLKGVANSAAEAFLRLGSEALWSGIIEKIKERLASTAIVQAFDSFISSIAGKLAGALGFGGAAAGQAVSGVAGAAGGAAGGLGQIGSAIVGQGLSATLGAVFGGISAVSGIIGNFQMRGMNKSLDLIEESTRYTAIGTVGNAGIIDTLRTYLPWLEIISDFNFRVQADLLGQINDALRYDVIQAIYDVRDVLQNSLTAPGLVPAFAGASTRTIIIPVTLNAREIARAIAEDTELGGGAV